MSTLEIVFLITLWIVYGIHSLQATKKDGWNKFELFGNEEGADRIYIVMEIIIWIVFSPLVLIARMLYGAFKHYEE